MALHLHCAGFRVQSKRLGLSIRRRVGIAGLRNAKGRAAQPIRDHPRVSRRSNRSEGGGAKVSGRHVLYITLTLATVAAFVFWVSVGNRPAPLPVAPAPAVLPTPLAPDYPWADIG
jgi:hypothetical protein